MMRNNNEKLHLKKGVRVSLFSMLLLFSCNSNKPCHCSYKDYGNEGVNSFSYYYSTPEASEIKGVRYLIFGSVPDDTLGVLIQDDLGITYRAYDKNSKSEKKLMKEQQLLYKYLSSGDSLLIKNFGPIYDYTWMVENINSDKIEFSLKNNSNFRGSHQAIFTKVVFGIDGKMKTLIFKAPNSGILTECSFNCE